MLRAHPLRKVAPQHEPRSRNFSPSSIAGAVGDTAQLKITATDSCGNFPVTLTSLGSYSSANESVATVVKTNPGKGKVSLVGAGSTQTTSNISYYWASPICKDPYGCSCVLKSDSDDTPVTVKPTVVIQPGPANVPLRAAGSSGPNSITRTASGNPSGGTFQWSTTSTKVTLQNQSSATVTIISQAESGTIGDVAIQVVYTLNNVPSDPATTNITVQKPTSLFLATTTSQGPAGDCDPGSAGWERNVRWEVRDRSGRAIQFQSISAEDQITISQSQNTCGAMARMGVGFTDVSGEFPDRYSICSTACVTGSCQTDATQTYTVNGFQLTDTKSLVFTCTSITINGN